MPKALMVVASNPASPEQEAEYNRWYVEDHFPDVLACHGFQRARRYSLSAVRPMGGVEPSPFKYLAVYEVEADDLAQAGAGVQAALDSGAITVSETFDLSNLTVDLYELVPGSEVSA
jgi:hypothetical protein